MTLAPKPAAITAQLVAAARDVIVGPIPAGGSLEGAGLRIVGIGWATVELDRAAAELGASLDLPAGAWTQAARDQLLGATALLGPSLGPDAQGPRVVLLEPDTEARLAASLARRGEGVAAVYVVDAPAESDAAPAPGDSAPGPARSAAAPGPMGIGRLVLGGPIWGPRVIVLAAATTPESLPSAGD